MKTPPLGAGLLKMTGSIPVKADHINHLLSLRPTKQFKKNLNSKWNMETKQPFSQLLVLMENKWNM